jgi:hypothetical protein
MQTNKHSRGITFFELILIISFIALIIIVLGLILSRTGKSTQTAAVHATLKQIANAVSMLDEDTGQWPNHLPRGSIQSGKSGNELWDLTVASAGIVISDGTYPEWKGPYLRDLRLDPWENKYFFDPDYDIDPTSGETWAAVVGSFGPNGKGKNIYDSDNIFEVIGTK